MKQGDRITPLIITLDEADNIERTLSALSWAKDIVVVDSGSTDGTLEMLENNPRVRVFHRSFDSFAQQCTYGASETGVSTPWILSLDADHVLSEELVRELREVGERDDIVGYLGSFSYCIEGRALRGSLYPPRVVLFRAGRGRFVNDGHGHFVEVDGPVGRLQGPIFHDDRKPLRRWLEAQGRYMPTEATKLSQAAFSELGWADRVRKLHVIAPFAVLAYCLVAKRGLLDGAAGWHYAFQRMVAEAVLSMNLLERRLGRGAPSGAGGRTVQDRDHDSPDAEASREADL